MAMLATEEAVLVVREAAKVLLNIPGVHTVGAMLGRRIPATIEARPTDDLLTTVLEAFAQHGSASLRDDIGRWMPSVPRIGGRAFDEIVDELRARDRGSIMAAQRPDC